MAEKTASVKLTVNASGLVQGMKQLEGQSRRTSRVVQETLSGAIVKWVRDTIKAGATLGTNLRKTFGDIRKTVSSIKLNKEGFLSALTTIDAKALVVARRMKSAFSSAVRGIGGGALGGGAGLAKGVGGSLGFGQIASGEAAGGLIADTVKAAVSAGVGLAKEANAVQEAANRLSVASRAPGQQGADPRQLAAEFFAVAREVKGVTADAAADAASRFVSLTGDLTTARSSLMDFAEAAAASGAQVGDVAEAAASISQQFKVTDPRQMREVLAALIYQGKQGSFELKDAASQFQRLAASGAAFGIPKSAEGVKVLGGLTQIARSGTGSGEQAATAVENLLTNLKTKQKDLGAAGIKVFEGGKTRDVRDLIVDAITKVGGTNVGKKQSGLAEIFGQEGIRAVNPLISLFNDTFRQTQGTEQQRTAAAVAALRAKMEEAINTTGSWSDVLDDSAQTQRNASARLTAVYEDVKGKVGDALAPKIDELVQQLENSPGAIEGFVKMMELAADAAGVVALAFEALGYLTGNKTVLEMQKDVQAQQQEREAAQVDKKLKALQMSPDEIAKLEQSDPKRLGALRGDAALLQLDRDTKLRTAQRLRDEVAQGMESRGDKAVALKKGIADKFLSAPAAGGAAPAGGVQEVRVPGELKVRVMNPNDLKSPAAPAGAAGAPTTPGYLPR